MEVHQGGLVLARKCPDSPGTCNPEETRVPVFQCLDLQILPDLENRVLFSRSCSVGLPPVPWTDKTIEMSPFSCDAEVIAAAKT